MAGDTDERLYGIAQGSEGGTIQPEEHLPIKVLIVDDHPIVRDGIVALLRLENDIEIVGQAENGREAVDLTRESSPDVVLMDLLMPVMSGLEATRVIRAAGWPARVLVLSQYDDEENVVASREAGASGFIPKTKAGSFLLDGIRSVRRGVHSAPPNAASAGWRPTGAPSPSQAEPLKSAFWW
jgi:DNA-binding NarL/FixJ family response regulator